MKKLALLSILLFSLNSNAVTKKIEVLGMVCAFCAQGLETVSYTHLTLPTTD